MWFLLVLFGSYMNHIQGWMSENAAGMLWEKDVCSKTVQHTSMHMVLNSLFNLCAGLLSGVPLGSAGMGSALRYPSSFRPQKTRIFFLEVRFIEEVRLSI